LIRTFDKYKPNVQHCKTFQKKPYVKNNNTRNTQDFSMYRDPWIPLVRRLVSSGKLTEQELLSDYSFMKAPSAAAPQLVTEVEDVTTNSDEKLEIIETINDEEIDIDL
jgi:hypothetical protein